MTLEPRTPTKRRVPKQKRSKETVERILDTATRLMADPDVGKLSTHMIAKEAGIAVGSVYQFFPNIETIKVALLERVMTQLYDQLAEVLVGSSEIEDFAEMSDRLVTGTLAFYHQYPDIIKIIVAGSHTEEFLAVNTELNNKLADLITDYLVDRSVTDPRNEIRRKVLTTLMIGDVMTMQIWTSEDAQEREGYVKDWLVLSRAFTQAL